jgi:PAS domain S-box-containing protein
MKKKVTNLSEPELLRQKAELFLSRNLPKTDSFPTEADSLKLIHELQVHQIELEMQNEELMQAKELAEAATKKAEALFDFAPSGYFTVAQNGEIIEINLTGAKMLGKDRYLLKNKIFTFFIVPSSKPIFSRFLYKVFESRTRQSCEIEVLSAGVSTYIYLTGVVIENSPNCWLTGENITELRQTENALQKSESRFKNMFYSHNAIMLLIDPESGRIVDANEAASLFYGYSRAKLLSMRIEEINSLAYDHVKIEFELAAKEAKNYFIFNHRLSNGEKRIVEVHSSPIVIEGQRVLYSIIHDITNRKKAEEELIESEENFRNIFENSIVGNTQTFINGIIKANRSFCDITGYSQEELSKLNLAAITHPDDVLRDENIVNSLLAGKSSFARWEKRYIHKNGNFVWVDISTTLQRDTEGMPKYFISSAIDITKNKLADEAIKRSETILRLFIEHSPAAIAMFDCQMKYIAASHRFLIDYDIDDQNIIGRSHYEVFSEIPQRWKDIHNRCLSGSTEQSEEDPFLRRNGKLDWIKWEICPWYESDNKIGGIILFSEVITKRKLAEESLRTSVQLTKNIIDNTPSLFYLVDLEGKFVLINQKLETILGIPGEKLIGNTRESFLPKEIADQHRANDLIVMESRQPLTFEEDNIEPDGKHFYLTQKFPLFNPAGKVYAVGGISTDITENKKVMENLKISEAKWHNLYEILPVGVSIVDLNNKILDLNPTLSQILDISKEGLLKGDFRQRIYLRPDLTQMISEEFPSNRSIKEKKMIRDVEIGVKKEDGSIIWTNVSAVPFSSFDACITVTTDITERKKLLDKLEETNQKLIDAQVVAKVGSWETNLSNMEVKWSEETFRIFGQDMYFHINHQSFLDFVHPEDRAKVNEAFVESLNTHAANTIQHRILTPTGKIKFVEENWIIYYNDQNQAIRALGTCSDITERKLAAEELVKSEEKWKSLVFNSPDVIALHDREGRYLFINRYAEGFSEKEVLGKVSFDNISPESREIFRAAFKKCIREMTKQEIKYKAMGNNRETRIYESSLVPFLVKDNEINVLVVARDITERMKADEEIRKSREQLAQLHKHLNEVREEERTSIAREIHDDLGQSLAGLKIDLLGIQEDINDEICRTQPIEKAISLVETTIKTVQKISSQLRPQMLDELGLASAIEWQASEFKKRTGINCKLKLDEIDGLAGNIAISLFRIFQAALTNIMRHSKATSVSVKLETKDQIILLQVIDNGIGITHEQLYSAKSFGIIGMRERANQINGKLRIKTGVNIGTEIIVSVPLV